MVSPTQTKPRSMARMRRYKESDLSRLEELFRQNFPGLVHPDLSAERNELNLLLEDSGGEIKMAVVGGRIPVAFPLIDPKSRVEREEFAALLGAAENELWQKRIAPCPLVLWMPETDFLHRLLVESFGFKSYRDLAPHAKFLEVSSVTEKNQEN